MATMTKGNQQSPTVVRVIGGLKLLKGLLLLAVAVGALKLLHKDVSEELSRFIQGLNVDPNSHFFNKLFEKAARLDAHKLLLGAVGTFVYSGLFQTEGVGLLMVKHWAEYFAAIITASFLPLEIYEVAVKFSAVKVVVIVLNAVIVAYLVWRLRKEHKERTAGKA